MILLVLFTVILILGIILLNILIAKAVYCYKEIKDQEDKYKFKVLAELIYMHQSNPFILKLKCCNRCKNSKP